MNELEKIGRLWDIQYTLGLGWNPRIRISGMRALASLTSPRLVGEVMS